MADDNKAVGPLATARLVALIKAETAKKYDKTGGKIDGSAEITGDVHAGGAVQSDLLLSAPSVAVHNGAGASVHINCSGDNAAGISSLGSDGKSHYSRFAVGTPTGDNDATTKAYVDGRTHDYYDVTVISAADAAQTIDGGIISVRGSADKTVAEIAAAYAAGAIVRCIYGGNIMPLVRAEDGSYSFAGTGANYGVARDGNITVTIMSTTSTGDTTLITSAAGELPIPDSDVSQNGCALVVRDGQWMYSEDKLIPATPTSNGLMSAADKAKLDSMDSVCYDIYAKIGTADTHDSVYKYGCMVSHTFAEITLDISDVNENTPTLLTGVKTPTDTDTNASATVEYVKNKVSEVAASGGVDVDNALSATSTNPVQNKVVKAALDKKAGTAVATTSANGLMSKADKTKLDDIEMGANKTTIDSAMSGSSVNPVQNKVIKQYIDDKVAADGSNITVDAELSATSTNPVQNKAVKAAIDGKADKTALNAKMDKSGGTFTGNVHGKYFCGTWLQSTEASDLGRTPGKIAVLDDSGWVYYRTPSELFSDLGIANAIKSHVDTAIAAAINSAY